MTEKKHNKRPASGGGDRPLRRRTMNAPGAPADKRGGGPAADKPRFGKPHVGKAGFDKPRFDKPARPRPDGARAKRPVEGRAVTPEPTREKAFEGERIAKVMARAGVCSRRDAESWIAEGRVAVNGRTLTNPAVNVRETDKIAVDGAPLQERERTRLFLFHKPAGFVTSARDPEGRATVFAYLDEHHSELPRLVSVGRLDINTEGLLLLTNDGGLARTLELPATGWTRRYRVRAHGEIDQARLDTLRMGVTVDGVAYAPIEATLDRVQGANVWLTMSLTEGKNREIKRVMEHLGLDVTRLIRVSYGPFQLGDIAEGAVDEVRLKVLREQLGKGLAELARVDFSSPLRDRAELSASEKQEMRERAERRPRKHVSVLRKQRDEKTEKGPRARIERGATADRKGRAVTVERVVPTRRKDDGAQGATRNARRFDAMRRDESSNERPRARDARSDRDEGRAPRGRAPVRSDVRPHGDRQFERPRRERDASERFEKRGGERTRGAGDVAATSRGANARSSDSPRYERPRSSQRFEKPREERDHGATRAPRDGGDARSGQRTRTGGPSAGRSASGRKFDAPRQERQRGEGGFNVKSRDFDARKSDAPRARGGDAARPPRGAGGPPRSGPHKGPRKGPFKGPRKGPPKSPRKPRGAH